MQEISVQQLASEITLMTEDYSNKLKELAEVRILKASKILLLKAESKTMREAELKWQSSEHGKKEIYLEIVVSNSTILELRIMNEEQGNVGPIVCTFNK